MPKSYDELLEESDKVAFSNSEKEAMIDPMIADSIRDLLAAKGAYTVASINVDRCGHTTIDRVNEAKASIRFENAYSRLVDLIIDSNKNTAALHLANESTSDLNSRLKAKLANIKALIEL